MNLLRKARFPHVDLIAKKSRCTNACAQEGNICRRCDLPQPLRGRKCRLDRQIAEARRLIVL